MSCAAVVQMKPMLFAQGLGHFVDPTPAIKYCCLRSAESSKSAHAGKKLLTGKVASPADIAECYLYCMKAGFTTGSNVVADGGGLLTL